MAKALETQDKNENNAQGGVKGWTQRLSEKIFPGVWKEQRTRRIAYNMITRFAVMVISIIIVTATFICVRFNVAMRNESAKLTNGIGTQMRINVDNNLSTVEANANMTLASEYAHAYNPVKRKYSASEALMYEKTILNDLNMQSGLRNYTDYAIVYSDGKILGLQSEITKELYGDTLYQSMAQELEAKDSAWVIGYNNDYSLAYYALRINDNGILVLSSDITELLGTVKADEILPDATLYLTNENMTTLYSTDAAEKVGKKLSAALNKRVVKEGGTKLDSRYFVNTAVTANDWLIVMVMPASELTEATLNTVVYVIIIGIIFSIIAVIMTIRMSVRIINSFNQTVHNLDVKAQIDLLTGILNKKSFEEIVDKEMYTLSDEYNFAMVFMDVDDFKLVNDRCGHDVGDEVLKFFARSMQRAFRDVDIKGRLGGDEFCVLMKISKNAECDVKTQAEAACKRFYDILHSISQMGRHEIPSITSSMGIAIAGEKDKGFNDLYKKADTALYESKRSGKDRWTVYHTGLAEKTE